MIEMDILSFNCANTLCLIVCMFAWLPSTEGYGTGAGGGACTTLRPAHGTPSDGTSPYSIQVLNGVNTYTFGTPVTGMFTFYAFLHASLNNGAS